MNKRDKTPPNPCFQGLYSLGESDDNNINIIANNVSSLQEDGGCCAGLVAQDGGVLEATAAGRWGAVWGGMIRKVQWTGSWGAGR